MIVALHTVLRCAPDECDSIKKRLQKFNFPNQSNTKVKTVEKVKGKSQRRGISKDESESLGSSPALP